MCTIRIIFTSLIVEVELTVYQIREGWIVAISSCNCEHVSVYECIFLFESVKINLVCSKN